MNSARLLACLLFCLVVAAARAADWYALTPDEFARLPEARERIDPANFSRERMNAAIFHETNRVRRRLGLPLFTHLLRLDGAADLKATIGVVQMNISHDNPLPATATVAQRVEVMGLDYHEVAENLARLTIFDVPFGTRQVGVRSEGPPPKYYHLDTGQPIHPHTYTGFAAAVVDAWMNSPGHRENLLNVRLVSLGCSARPCRSPGGQLDQIYAVQVFFTPAGGPRKGR
jgi:uncharacterized protein YkwD